ncbi:MAG: exopolysaccharide biosynthesis polyprenyl glycosylphosphotransferase [Alphaproteobacteria bacterium]
MKSAKNHKALPNPFAGKIRPWVAIIHFLTFLLDALALYLIYKYAIPITLSFTDFLNQPVTSGLCLSLDKYLTISCTLSLGSMIAFLYTGHYTSRVPWWTQVYFITKVILVLVVLEAVPAYLLGLCIPPALVIIHWAAALIFLICSRMATYQIKKRARSWKLPTVIIADVDTLTTILFAMSTDIGVGLDPKYGVIRDKISKTLPPEELPDRYKDIKILNGLTDYREFIRSHTHYYYVISMESFRGTKRDSVLKLLADENVRFAIVPVISHMSLYHSRSLYFFGNDVMLMETREFYLSSFQKFIKRCVDIIGSAIGLFLCALPMLAVALLLKREKKNQSVFYNGARIGEYGATFHCWKFRTMEPDPDHLLETYLANNPEENENWERYFKLENDPRIKSKTAKFLRQTSIDELPQLWNVLKGDMSLVGPRPILPNEMDSYGDNLDQYVSVKPGLTGLWQVSGRNQTSFNRRIVLDGWYVRNWSFWGDIVIILKTFYVVITRSGAS